MTTDELARHEALDRAFLASDSFDRCLLDHPGVTSDPDLAKAAKEASDALARLYTLVAEKFAT